MKQFDNIIQNIISFGEKDENLLAALIIGSHARIDHPGDEFSDLDVIIIAGSSEIYLESDQWIEEIGDFYISFTEDTFAGGKERRILFEGALDVDFIILTESQMRTVMEHEGMEILQRGYRFLIDKMAFEKSLPSFEKGRFGVSLLESEFDNIVNDFWYHAVWTAKKIARGELWTAISCVDGYMKTRLLAIIEEHTRMIKGVNCDTWHNGRFLEEWAEKWIVEKLSECYAHYQRKDMGKALLSTMELFRLAAREIAEKRNFGYPQKTDEYAAEWVMKLTRKQPKGEE